MPRTRKTRVALLVLLAAPAVLAGCSQTDPYQRSGMWKPAGVNDANIAAQVANPADLARGRGTTEGTVRTATTAVDRMWQGAPAQRQQQGQGPQGGNPLATRQGGGSEAQR